MELGAIGECMLELHDEGGSNMRKSFGGDVLNTLLYASRCGSDGFFCDRCGE